MKKFVGRVLFLSTFLFMISSKDSPAGVDEVDALIVGSSFLTLAIGTIVVALIHDRDPVPELKQAVTQKLPGQSFSNSDAHRLALQNVSAIHGFKF